MARAFIEGHAVLVDHIKTRVLFYEVRYEDLIKDTDRVLRNLCESLQISFHQNMLRHHEQHHRYAAHYSDDRARLPVFNGSINQWSEWKAQNEICKEDQDLLRELSEILGYNEEK